MAMPSPSPPYRGTGQAPLDSGLRRNDGVVGLSAIFIGMTDWC